MVSTPFINPDDKTISAFSFLINPKMAAFAFVDGNVCIYNIESRPAELISTFNPPDEGMIFSIYQHKSYEEAVNISHDYLILVHSQMIYVLSIEGYKNISFKF